MFRLEKNLGRENQRSSVLQRGNGVRPCSVRTDQRRYVLFAGSLSCVGRASFIHREPQSSDCVRMKIYCEHGALSAAIVKLQRTGRIEILHFRYDPDSRSRHLKKTAIPSAARISDLNYAISELPGALADYVGSEHLERIAEIIGAQHRRDILHVDSAFKSGCRAFVTRDTDILVHAKALDALLGISIFHPDRDMQELTDFVDQ